MSALGTIIPDADDTRLYIVVSPDDYSPINITTLGGMCGFPTGVSPQWTLGLEDCGVGGLCVVCVVPPSPLGSGTGGLCTTCGVCPDLSG